MYKADIKVGTQYALRERRGEQFGLRDGQLSGGQLRAVEAGGEFEQRLVAPAADGFHDALGAFLDGGIEETGGGGQPGEFFGEIFIGVTNDIHARRKARRSAEDCQKSMAPILLLSEAPL